MSEPEIPKQHKALVYSKPGTIAIEEKMVDTPSPGPGEVLINLTHTGVCHSDYSLMMNRWKTFPYPTQPGQVGGHEGVGKVVAFGAGAESSGLKIGDRVGVKWVASCCGTCAPCLDCNDALCRKVKISGYYTPGTYQQYVLGPANYVTKIPDNVSSEDAAPFLCAGITVYSALKRSNARAGQWVVISGAGGGLGHLATQIATHSMGFRVIGIDGGNKEDFVTKELGAEGFIGVDSGISEEDMGKKVKELTGGLGAAAVIVCIGSNAAYSAAVGMLQPAGTIVCVGMPEGESEGIKGLGPTKMVSGLYTLTSAAVGNRRDATEVLDLAARGLVKTKVEVVKMGKLEETFHRMEEGKLHGRVVLDLS